MSRPRTTAAFRNPVKRAFDSLAEHLKQERKNPARESDEKMHVSKQTAYRYLKCKTIPGPDRLAKLVHAWDVDLHIDGHNFGKSAFGRLRANANVNSIYRVLLDFAEMAEGPTEISLPSTESKLRFTAKGSTLSVSIYIKRSD